MTNIPWLEELEEPGGLDQLRLVLPHGVDKDEHVLLDEVRRSVGDRSLAGLSCGGGPDLNVADIFPADLVRGADPFAGAGTQFRDLLPSPDKSEWVLRHLGVDDKRAMAEDLFRVSVEVCRTRDLRPLENAVLSWEATAEESVDTRREGVRDEGETDTPASIDELRVRLS